MTMREFQSWAAYRAKRGSLNAGLMIEHAIATLSAMYANTHSKSARYRTHHFMPHFDEPPISLDQAMEEWV